MLPAAAKEALRAHLVDVRRVHDADRADGLGRVALPFAITRKYPTAATEWKWQFVFPATRICRDARFGPPSRYHLHESVVQKAVAQAARSAGLTKRVGPHAPLLCDASARGWLRHPYGAGAAGTSRRAHDDDISARDAARRAGCEEPARPTMTRVVTREASALPPDHAIQRAARSACGPAASKRRAPIALVDTTPTLARNHADRPIGRRFWLFCFARIHTASRAMEVGRILVGSAGCCVSARRRPWRGYAPPGGLLFVSRIEIRRIGVRSKNWQNRPR